MWQTKFNTHTKQRTKQYYVLRALLRQSSRRVWGACPWMPFAHIWHRNMQSKNYVSKLFPEHSSILHSKQPVRFPFLFFLPSTLQTYSICSTQKDHYDRMKSCRISRSTSSEMTSLIAHFSRIFAHLRGLMDHSTLGRPCLTNGKSNTQETAQNLHRFSQALVSFPEPSCFMFRHKFKTM